MISYTYAVDDCQYWLNVTDGTLKSPFHYNHNLNCKWLLQGDPGYYVLLEFNFFNVVSCHQKQLLVVEN